MNQFNIFLVGVSTAFLAIVINILVSWIKGEPIHLSPKKIIITLVILLIFEVPLSYFGNPVPALPSGIDNEAIDTTKSLWNNEGVTLYRLGNYTGAIWYYDKAIEMDSGYAFAWSNKGIALEALHYDAEAEKAFAKARGDP